MAARRTRRRERRDYWGAFVQDGRFAVRTLLRAPGFAAVAVLILALGIGANTAIFSVIDTMLLRPLPFPAAGQLTWLASGRELDQRLRSAVGLSATTYSVSAYEEFRAHNHSFQSVTAYDPFFGNSEYTILAGIEPQQVAGVLVACNFFQTLGVQPELGRLFSPEECRPGGRRAMLLSDPIWRRQFNADPAVVGRGVRLSGQEVTIVGVLPASFDFGSIFSPGLRVDAYVPAVMDAMRNWGNTLAVVGRLNPAVSVSQAQAEADVLFPQLAAVHPEWGLHYLSTLTPLQEFVTGSLRRSLLVLWCAVGLVLLIACVNLSNLLLARTMARSREFAVRGALGGGRARLVRQILTESLVLSSLGAACGLLLAFGLTRWVAHQHSVALPLLSRVTLDRSALAWALLIATLATVLFSLAPALRISSEDVQVGLKDGGRGASSGRRHERLRTALVVAEVALSCVLLVGAGLLLRSFLSVLDVNLGFQPERAAVMKVDYDDGGDQARRAAMLQEMLQRVEAIPGVEAAGIADMLPLGRNRSWDFKARGHVPRKDEIDVALVRVVTPGYIESMGMRLPRRS